MSHILPLLKRVNLFKGLKNRPRFLKHLEIGILLNSLFDNLQQIMTGPQSLGKVLNSSLLDYKVNLFKKNFPDLIPP